MIDVIEYSKYEKNNLLKILEERNNTKSNNIEDKVRNIIETVKDYGDRALINFTKQFDNIMLEDLRVTEDEIEEAYNSVDKEFIDILKESKENIKAYHEKQKKLGYIYTKENGVYMGQRIIPIESVGVYVPGGKAAYPSSVLMNVIPAKIAGVKKIVMVTPPSLNGEVNKNILAAAKISGVDEVFKVGGAQAIAALAYGTETIEAVCTIVGPGNAYVAEAKRQVYGKVGIDMIAGPSEVLIIADEAANEKFIAADLMAQAEHDEMASSILITTSMNLAKKVNNEVKVKVEDLDRKEIIKKSLKSYGKIIVCNNIDECIDISNKISPEHLEILLKNPMEYLEKIKNAGSIFLGEYTPEPMGDYFAGTNHVLPTCRSARFSSPLSLDTFTKKSSYLYYSKEALLNCGEKVVKFAKEEGLTAHGNSIKVRLEYEEN
ncbi:histidinol dehydrogenase [Clostridium celatum]|uniref:histidinol dehydrogenase n=1 Tax=Clostridium celatum TaxID=36834 RepID=UPI0029106405|nr:histidinol dehydrogenase [Clostridium celatum]MDU6294872.1 histidinol dehydrogenase [Clostridium celatum]